MFEGCAFLVYDKQLVLYSEAIHGSPRHQEVLTVTVDGDYKYKDNRSLLYGSCEVASGSYTGSYAVSNGASRVYKISDPGKIGSTMQKPHASQKNFLTVEKQRLSGGFCTFPNPNRLCSRINCRVEKCACAVVGWYGLSRSCTQ